VIAAGQRSDEDTAPVFKRLGRRREKYTMEKMSFMRLVCI
jgi:hypothetical protein